ncbi:hypothetical protein IFO70_22465 [Phormidium tenue FACHB-886]|nr:hypothetical protein [Phormidium tenue FACHB-886]
MRLFQWLQALRSLGLEFWLSLPLLGFAFWLGGSWLTARLINHSTFDAARLQVEVGAQPAQPLDQPLSIRVEIDRQQGTSTVKVVTLARSLQAQKFQVPSTALNQIETSIGRALKLSPEQVKQLVRYEIKD